MNIVIIDDHHLFLHGMQLMLNQVGWQVNCYEKAEIALEAIPELAPDLILIDLSMPAMDGYSMIQALDSRDWLYPVAVVSASEDTQLISDVLEAGAMGFIPKSYQPDELVQAIEHIIDGQVHIPTAIKARIKALKQQQAQPHASLLSKRQLDVLKLLVKGYPNKRVSVILNISEDTVKFHIRGIFKALEVSNRTEAVTKASELGLILSLHQVSGQ
ncbi:response regulator transcription factor [Motilimonas pumila]|uniref:DNA-binding response regulator n=1 Tax=Motilimonas pumila TaxID=2303987 RepID=A0A418YFF1_9GAMM|nr:response regulator transcription factor [Motilimonas pumila]RJG47869.1 DNA-binding response regulator [Motilimonas pumila]